MANISNSAGNSSPKETEEAGFDAFIDVPLLTMCVLIIATNGLVVGLFSYKQSLRTPSNVFLASLAVSDGVSSVLGIPLFIACSATTSEEACVPTTVFLRFSAVCAMLHLSVIALDRYVFIAHPLKYPSHMCHRAAALALCLLYLASLVVALAQLSWLDLSALDVTQNADPRVIAIEKRYFLFCFVAFFCVPVLLTSFCYGSILLITLRHNRAILRQRRRRSQRGVLNALGRCRGSFVLWAMFFIFTICLLPNFILGLQHHMGNELFGEFPVWLENALYFLRFTPPLSNPVLCTFFKQDFKSALRTWWKKLRTHIFRSCLSRRAEMQNRSVVYSSTPRRESVSLMDTCSEYWRSRSPRETGNFQESTSTPL